MNDTRFASRRTGLARLALPAFALAGALVSGCGVTHRTAPAGHAVDGSVSISIPVTNSVGDTISEEYDTTPSGIIVRFLGAVGLGDSTTTVNGAFHLHTGNAAYHLVVGPTLATSDTLGPFATSLANPGIGLRTRGTLSLLNSKFVPGTGSVTIAFALAQDAHVVLKVRALDGSVIRVLADRMFAAGSYRLVWDGTTDAAANTPPGTYWITCEAGTGPSPARAVRPVDIVPVPVTPSQDSRGSRAAVILTAS